MKVEEVFNCKDGWLFCDVNKVMIIFEQIIIE